MFFDNSIYVEIDLDLNDYAGEILDRLKLEGGSDAIFILEKNNHFGADDLYMIRNYCDKKLQEIFENEISRETYQTNRDLRDRIEALEKQIREMNGTI